MDELRKKSYERRNKHAVRVKFNFDLVLVHRDVSRVGDSSSTRKLLPVCQLVFSGAYWTASVMKYHLNQGFHLR